MLASSLKISSRLSWCLSFSTRPPATHYQRGYTVVEDQLGRLGRVGCGGWGSTEGEKQRREGEGEGGERDGEASRPWTSARGHAHKRGRRHAGTCGQARGQARGRARAHPPPAYSRAHAPAWVSACVHGLSVRGRLRVCGRCVHIPPPPPQRQRPPTQRRDLSTAHRQLHGLSTRRFTGQGSLLH
jgi:hypothetical protein